MNQGIKERISALVDGELSEFEVRRVLKEIELDNELKEYWLRLQVIKDGLNDNSLGFLNRDVSKKIASKLGELPKEKIIQEMPLNNNKFYLGFAVAAILVIFVSTGIITNSEPVSSPEDTFASEASKKIAEAIASPEALKVLEKALVGMNATLENMNSDTRGQVYANYKIPSTGKTFRVSLSPITTTPPNANSSKLAYLNTKEGMLIISVSGNISSEKKSQILRNANFSSNN